MSPAQARLALLGALVTHHHPVEPRHVAAYPATNGFGWRYRCPRCWTTKRGRDKDLGEAIAAIRLCPRQCHDRAGYPQKADGGQLLPFHPSLGA